MTSNGDDNASTKGNGEQPVSGSRIVLTFTALPWHLDIKATVENFDMALAMLDQARRWFEQQMRAQAAVELQKQMAEQKKTAELLDSIRGRRG